MFRVLIIGEPDLRVNEINRASPNVASQTAGVSRRIKINGEGGFVRTAHKEVIKIISSRVNRILNKWAC